ncbi:hypothetical protein TRICI_005156 [Trichomonascus ciferrii]|uniref:Uncharacterized protein n=1 Tax=Trichomonascus ciferrii TaxID=44093 RepID=A0A642UW40_9ASCO|nr:hypothetical protein TRICI_005156 [Trichomonascus ciferrii]
MWRRRKMQRHTEMNCSPPLARPQAWSRTLDPTQPCLGPTENAPAATIRNASSSRVSNDDLKLPWSSSTCASPAVTSLEAWSKNNTYLLYL